MSEAASRYYQKHRDEILAKARVRDAAKREELRRIARESREGLEEVREIYREKYHRNVESRITRQLHTWLEDPGICDTFKTFVRECVWQHRATLPPAFVRGLGKMSIAVSFDRDIPDVNVDALRTREASGAEDSGTEAEDRD